MIDDKNTRLIESLRNDLALSRKNNFKMSDELRKLNKSLETYKDAVRQFKETLAEMDEIILLNKEDKQND